MTDVNDVVVVIVGAVVVIEVVVVGDVEVEFEVEVVGVVETIVVLSLGLFPPLRFDADSTNELVPVPSPRAAATPIFATFAGESTVPPHPKFTSAIPTK